jgi:hypothetical protein
VERNRNKWGSMLSALLALASPVVLGVPVFAAVPPAGAAAGAEGEVMEEVLVRGTRLYELRAAIIAAEDRFYARYNEINPIDDYDIDCNQVKRTGTNFQTRRCAPRLLDKVLAADAREVLQAMQEGREKRGEDPTVTLTRRNGEYKANMLQLLRDDRQLRALVRDRDKAQERYDREHKKRMKGRLILADWFDQE